MLIKHFTSYLCIIAYNEHKKNKHQSHRLYIKIYNGKKIENQEENLFHKHYKEYLINHKYLVQFLSPMPSPVREIITIQ